MAGRKNGIKRDQKKVQNRSAVNGGPKKRGRKKSYADSSPLDREEIRVTVCHYFFKGKRPEMIAKLMRENHQVNMTRQEPYRIIHEAIMEGWIDFNPPLHAELRRRLKEKYGVGLRNVEVVHTAVQDQVARQGAEMLLELVRELADHPEPKEEVNIGFSGGHSMREVAREFAKLLRNGAEGLPRKIVFRALVSAFDAHEPFNNPSGFFTYFADDPAIMIERIFFCLPDPLNVQHYRALQKCDQVKALYAGAEKLDVAVTSASSYEDDHGIFKRYLTDKSNREIEEAKIVGDMMLLPVGPNGLVDIPTATRALTLLKPGEFHEFVKRGLRVLLVLGPCGICHTPKTKILQALLDQKDKLITHLVVDSMTAKGLFVDAA